MQFFIDSSCKPLDDRKLTDKSILQPESTAYEILPGPFCLSAVICVHREFHAAQGIFFLSGFHKIQSVLFRVSSKISPSPG
jgi:hypothetical protein